MFSSLSFKQSKKISTADSTKGSSSLFNGGQSGIYVGEPSGVTMTSIAQRDSGMFDGGFRPSKLNLLRGTSDSSKVATPASPLSENDFDFIPDYYDDRPISKTLPRGRKSNIRDLYPNMTSPDEVEQHLTASSMDHLQGSSMLSLSMLSYAGPIDEDRPDTPSSSHSYKYRGTISKDQTVEPPVNYHAFTMERANKKLLEEHSKMIPGRFKGNLRLISVQKQLIRLETNKQTFLEMMTELDPTGSRSRGSSKLDMNAYEEIPSKKSPRARNASSYNLGHSVSMKTNSRRDFSNDRLNKALGKNRRKSDSTKPDVAKIMHAEGKNYQKPVITLSVRQDDYSNLMSAITGHSKNSFLTNKQTISLNYVNLFIKSFDQAEVKRGGKEIPMRGRAIIVRHSVYFSHQTQKDVAHPIIMFCLPLPFSVVGKQVRLLEACYSSPPNPSDDETVVSFNADGLDDIHLGFQPEWKIEVLKKSYHRHRQTSQSLTPSPAVVKKEILAKEKVVDTISLPGGRNTPEIPRRPRASGIDSDLTGV